MSQRYRGIIGFLLLVLVQTKIASTDFGLPMAFVGGPMITSSANSINGVLNMLNMNVKKYSPLKQDGHLRESSEKIAQMAQKVADLGKLLASNVTKAANDRGTPIKELFDALQGSYDQMSQYLKSDALAAMNSLDDGLKTTELGNALDGVSEAIANITAITEEFHRAIGETLHAANGKPVNRGTVNTYIPPSLTISMSNALGQLKEQTAVLSKTVEYMLKNIAVVHAHMVRVNATALTLEQKINATLLTMEQQYRTEADIVIKRLAISQNSVKNEISNAIGKLAIFQTNRTLLELVDGFSEAYTKVYYYLYNRNQTDVDNIRQAYNETVSNMKQLTLNLHNNITTEMQQTAFTVGFEYLNRNANFDNCFVNHQNQIFAAFTTINNAATICLNREKTRVGRLPDVLDRYLRQTEANTEDFSFNIATCSAQSAFEKSPITYLQAYTCLNTILNHSEGFQQVIGQGYDTMLQMLRTEVAGSRFRLGDCLESRGNEGLALIEGLTRDVDQCLYGKRSFVGVKQDVELSTTAQGELSVKEFNTTRSDETFYGEPVEEMLGNY